MILKIGGIPKLIATFKISKFLGARNVGSIVVSNKEDIVQCVDEDPCLVIVGTSPASNDLGIALLEETKKRKIPTVGVVDAIMSASLRFKGLNKDPLSHVPDELLVVNEETKSAFTSLGYPLNDIYVTGHPHYQALIKKNKNITECHKNIIKKNILGDEYISKPIVTFVAEPRVLIENNSNFIGDWPQKWKNMERIQLALKVFCELIPDVLNRYVRVLRLHPKNKKNPFYQYNKYFDYVSINEDSDQLLLISDLFIGISSSLLLEAAIIGLPTISIQSRKNDETDIPVQFSKSINKVFSVDQMRDCLLDDTNMLVNSIYIDYPTNQILEKYLKQRVL